MDHPFEGHGESGYRWNFFDEKALELIPAVATQQPLTIVAGRYYKTRDGRKALASDNGDDSTYPFYHEVDGWGWHGVTAGGKSCIDRDQDDLIAEWPTGDAAAPVDNLADEYGPVVAADVAVAEATATRFRVGDRVKFRDDYGTSSAGKEATVVRTNVWEDGGGVMVDQGGKFGKSTEHAKDLLLVTDKPDSKLLVTITTDTSSLDAEIDRVKRRLKKLAKRARKLGIRLDYSDLRDAA